MKKSFFGFPWFDCGSKWIISRDYKWQDLISLKRNNIKSLRSRFHLRTLKTIWASLVSLFHIFSISIRNLLESYFSLWRNLIQSPNSILSSLVTKINLQNSCQLHLGLGISQMIWNRFIINWGKAKLLLLLQSETISKIWCIALSEETCCKQ